MPGVRTPQDDRAAFTRAPIGYPHCPRDNRGCETPNGASKRPGGIDRSPRDKPAWFTLPTGRHFHTRNGLKRRATTKQF